MAKKSPLQVLKEKYGSKKELIAKIADGLEPLEGESGDDFKTRLVRVANAKLLHLAVVADNVKRLGGRKGLTAKITDIQGKAKDKDYINKLARFSLSKLVDMQRSMERKSKSSS